MRAGDERIAAFRYARGAEFVETDQRDLPCPVLVEKIFRFSRRANHFYNSRRPDPQEGRCATSSTRAGMRWTRMALLTNGARGGRRSRVVLTPRRLVSSRRKFRRRR